MIYIQHNRAWGGLGQGWGTTRAVLHLMHPLLSVCSYTLECNYNSERLCNTVSPATTDGGRATPPCSPSLFAHKFNSAFLIMSRLAVTCV